jgi:C4-dicarboxylate-binding protein DctP
LLLIVVVGCGGTSGSAPSPPVNLRINIDIPENTPLGATVNHLKASLAAKVGSRVNVQIYFNSSLYNQTDELGALQQGNIELLVETPSQLIGVDPLMAALDLPYMFKSVSMYQAAFNDPKLGPQLLEPLHQKNLEVVGVISNSWREIASRRPIRTVEDMKGLKIRSLPGSQWSAFFNALGAKPVSLDFSQVPTALQQGLIDAQEPPPTGLLGGKIYKLVPNLTQSHHLLQSILVTVNYKWWHGLPADLRSAIQEVMKETSAFNLDQVETLTAQSVKTMTGDGLTEIKLGDSELARWEQIGLMADQQMASVLGADTMKNLLTLRDKYQWQRPTW